MAGCSGNLPWEGAPAQEIPLAVTPLPVQRGMRVAIVMPMTGPNAALSHAMLNAAILANYDIHNHDVTLIPMDQTAVEQNPQSLIDNHINVTIGPLTAEATQRLEPFAEQNHIRMFSLSNDVSLPNSNTVVFGYRVEAEIARIIPYAHARYKNRILAVVPKDAYGDAVTAALMATAGPPVQVIRFGTPEELTTGLKSILDTPDAIFIPVSGANLAPVLKTLADAGLTHNKTQYISTGVWDDEAIWKIPELDGAWYPSADPKQLQLYLQRYRTQYGAEPPRITALAYNAFAMIAILEKQNALDPFASGQLYNRSGFAGVDGLFRILPDGSVRRALAVVEISNRAPTVIQAAPDTTALSK
jgi:ABC-type branched-subunit amino acid transport system substrate-binding protein